MKDADVENAAAQPDIVGAQAYAKKMNHDCLQNKELKSLPTGQLPST